MELNEIREQIDAIDEELVGLFNKRMKLSAMVAIYKKENDLPIYVPEREQLILQKVAQGADPALSDYVRNLYWKIFELSRSYQEKCLDISEFSRINTEVV